MKIIHPGQEPNFFLGGHIDIDQLQSYKQDLVVINCASEHWGTDPGFLLNICDDLTDNGFDFWVLSHHPGDHNMHPRLLYYPWWYIYSHKKFEDVDISAPRSKVLGCLHGNPRPHRIANYFSLQEKFDTKKFHLSIYNANSMPRRADDVDITDSEIGKWELLAPKLTDRVSITTDFTIFIPALNDAYVHLTTETTVIDRIFISEKTWKPIAAGQLFLHFGNPGTIEFLRSLGVDTFDDIIDHTSYDHISDWRERMERIHVIIQDLINQDIEDIWNCTLSRREINKRRFFAGEFALVYQPELFKSIARILCTAPLN